MDPWTNVHTHIHQIAVVTTISLSSQAGLTKNDKFKLFL